MLYNIIGNVRSGKTLFATILATRSTKPVYANYHINIPQFKPLNVEDIFELNNCMIIVDEAYSWLEARLSQKDINRYLSYFLFQSGKRDTDIVLTSQYAKSVDIRFRMLSHYVIMARKNDQAQRFEYYVYPNIGGNPFIIVLTFKNAEKYFPFYETKEIIYPGEFELLKYKIMLADPRKKKQFIERILPEARKKIGKLTIDNVRAFLIENNLPTCIVRELYAVLKSSGEA